MANIYNHYVTRGQYRYHKIKTELNKMVDLTVKIEGGGVYVAGDSLYSSLSFHNKSSEPQTIAWVGAQIHCQCVVREAVVKLKEKEQVSSPVSDTAFFPNRGIVINEYLN